MNSTTLSRGAVFAAIASALVLAGCGLFDDDRPSVPFPITVGGTAHDLSFVFGEAVHEIDVEECTAGCDIRDEYCSFDASLESWRTGVGTDEPSGFADARRLPPTVQGPVSYGVLSPDADFETEAAPLREGAIYSVEADVYDLCDEDAAECLHVARYACAYFTVQDSRPVPLP